MTRIALWLLSTVTAVVLLFSFGPSTAGSVANAGGASKNIDLSGKPDPSKGPVVKVDGKPVNTRWGYVQVELAYQKDTIVGVTLLKMPDGNAMDTFIGNRSIPKLIAQTVKQQGKHIDMVSGATFTSGGYLASLQSALDMHHA